MWFDKAQTRQQYAFYMSVAQTVRRSIVEEGVACANDLRIIHRSIQAEAWRKANFINAAGPWAEASTGPNAACCLDIVVADSEWYLTRLVD